MAGMNMEKYIKYIVITFNTIIIAISIISLGNSIEKSKGESVLNGTLTLQDHEEEREEDSDYFSLPMLGTYLHASDEEIIVLLQTGKLDGSYIKIEDDYIFSKKKVQECLDKGMINP